MKTNVLKWYSNVFDLIYKFDAHKKKSTIMQYYVVSTYVYNENLTTGG